MCLVLFLYKIIFINKIYNFIIINIYIHIKNAIIYFINNDEYKLEGLLDTVIIILKKNIPFYKKDLINNI
jgi:hypothetical protein